MATLRETTFTKQKFAKALDVLAHGFIRCSFFSRSTQVVSS